MYEEFERDPRERNPRHFVCCLYPPPHTRCSCDGHRTRQTTNRFLQNAKNMQAFFCWRCVHSAFKCCFDVWPSEWVLWRFIARNASLVLCEEHRKNRWQKHRTSSWREIMCRWLPHITCHSKIRAKKWSKEHETPELVKKTYRILMNTRRMIPSKVNVDFFLMKNLWKIL